MCELLRVRASPNCSTIGVAIQSIFRGARRSMMKLLAKKTKKNKILSITKYTHTLWFSHANRSFSRKCAEKQTKERRKNYALGSVPMSLVNVIKLKIWKSRQKYSPLVFLLFYFHIHCSPFCFCVSPHQH